MPSRRAPAAVCAAVAGALAVAGCGLGPGDKQAGPDATVVITRDFGNRALGPVRGRAVRDDETVLRLLRSGHSVKTRYGGGFVQAIDGLAGRGSAGGSDWFYYVDGILGDTGAAERDVHPGEVLQWDYHPWRVAPNVRAIVGAFPRPLAGRRPVRLACPSPAARACGATRRALVRAGVRTAVGGLASAAGGSAPRVVAARWNVARQLPALRALARGPRASGVFARFGAGGRRLELLDAGGRPSEALGPGAGLVVALGPPGQPPLWLVTGGDDDSVQRAAGALTRRDLKQAFGVAVAPGGRVIRLPDEGSGP